MGVLGSKGSNALKYWGDILASAYANKSTADMWTAIRQTQATYGLAKPGADAIDVSVLRGYANKIANGAAAFASAAPTDSITPQMMGVAPFTAQDQAGIAATPTFQVRFQNIVQADDGTQTTVWQTSVFSPGTLPATVGELQDAIETDAGELAAQSDGGSINTPKGTSLGVANIEISVV